MADLPDHFIADFLRDRDIDCPTCGYNLRNNDSLHCPECGERLTLQLRPAIANQTAFLVGVIGLSTAVGFAILLSTVLALHEVINFFMIILALAGCLLTLILVAWLSAFRRLARLSCRWQWCLATVCWIPTLAMPIVLRLLDL